MIQTIFRYYVLSNNNILCTLNGSNIRYAKWKVQKSYQTIIIFEYWYSKL